MTRLHLLVTTLIVLFTGTVAYGQARMFGGRGIILDDNASNETYITTALGGIGINMINIGPDACAILDLNSQIKGFLPPRMVPLEIAALCGGAPPEGLIVYNTHTHTLDIWNGSGWTGQWQTKGNTNLSLDNIDNLLGSTALSTVKPFNFIVGGTRIMRYEVNNRIQGGHPNNTIHSLAHGAVIAGGGQLGSPNTISQHGLYSVIGGGRGNTANGQVGVGDAVVGGGSGNTAGGARSTIGGGFSNAANSSGSSILGGGNNTISTAAVHGSIGGGSTNSIGTFGLYSTIAGGRNNIANGDGGAGDAVVGGGINNTADGARTTIGGGFFNTSLMNASTIAGGANNTTTINAQYGTIAGGSSNTVDNYGGAVGGGLGNAANGVLSTIAGGYFNTASAPGSSIGGGGWNNAIAGGNTASGTASTIGGGFQNRATDDYGVVGGGQNNQAGNGGGSADRPHAAVLGGLNNTASGIYATVGAGRDNNASANNSTIGGGRSNTTSGIGATIAGGGDDGAITQGNTASGNASSIGGGLNNRATDNYSTVGGGQNNQAGNNAGPITDVTHATVGGGHNNAATGTYASVLGGFTNNATGGSSAIGGGANHNATGALATISGGQANTASGFGATVGGGSSNIASAQHSFLGGGLGNQVTDNWGTVGGGSGNQAGDNAGTTNDRNYAMVGGGLGNTASGQTSTVSGGTSNNATGQSSTVGGGAANVASGLLSTVSGGLGNDATGPGAFVGGGDNNVASSNNAAIAGGLFNNASGMMSAIGGGEQNTATNLYSAVGGGAGNDATGQSAFIGGGLNNTASNTEAVVAGGVANTVSGPRSSIGGGDFNSVTGIYSTIPGGVSLTVGANSFGYNGSGTANVSGQSGIAYFGNVDVLVGNTDNSAQQLRFYENNASATLAGADFASFQAPAAMTATTQYALPTSYGGAGGALAPYILTDISGAGTPRQLTWVSGNSTNWLLGGNSGITGANFIGTTDAADFIIKTGTLAVERMRFDGNPQIASNTDPLIEIDNPNTNQQGLRINGTADANGASTLAGTPGHWDLAVVGDAIVTGIFKNGGSMWFDGVSTPHSIKMNQRTQIGTTNNQDLAFITNGSERMYVDSTGKIGIGTKDPISFLHVKGAPPTVDSVNGAGMLIPRPLNHLVTFENVSTDEKGNGIAIILNAPGGIGAPQDVHVNNNQNYITFYNQPHTTGIRGRIEGFSWQNYWNVIDAAAQFAIDHLWDFFNPLGYFKFNLEFNTDYFVFDPGFIDFTLPTLPSLSGGSLPNIYGSLDCDDGDISFGVFCLNPGSFPSLSGGSVGSLSFSSPFPNITAGQSPITGWENPISINTDYIDDLIGFAASLPYKDKIAEFVTNRPAAAMKFAANFFGGVTYESGSGDYAEWLERADPSEKILPGDIVGVVGGKISKNTHGTNHLMVATWKPIVLGNMPPQDREQDFTKVAFMGQVPVKIKGGCRKGDYILPSGRGDGCARAISPSRIDAADLDNVVGIAWDDTYELGPAFAKVAVGLKPTEMVTVIQKQQAQIDRLQEQVNEIDLLKQEMAELKATVAASNSRMVKAPKTAKKPKFRYKTVSAK